MQDEQRAPRPFPHRRATNPRQPRRRWGLVREPLQDIADAAVVGGVRLRVDLARENARTSVRGSSERPSPSSSTIVRGLPGRGRRGARQAMLRERVRHFPTVEGQHPRAEAMSMLVWPSAAARTIRRRSANACALGRRVHRSRTWRSSSERTISARRRSVVASHSRPSNRMRETSRARAAVPAYCSWIYDSGD